MLYHYTYKLTILTPIDERKYYIGVRTTSVKPQEDSNYISSSKTIKALIKKHGKNIFKKEVIKIFDTRKEALEHEIELHNIYNVSSNNEFFNRAIQTSTGFDTTGIPVNHNDETKKTISNKAKHRYANGFRVVPSQEQLEKMSMSLKNYYKNTDHHTKGKTYEEIMGKEKAEELRKIRTENNPMKNKAYREKISLALKGTKKTEETKKQLSELIPITNGLNNKRIKPDLLTEYLDIGWWKGYTRKPEKTYKCEHCDTETNKGNLLRWHNSNCKFKKM